MDPALLRRAYDREAARYDERFRDQQLPKISRVFEVVPPPAPGDRVLDLGAGTGLFAACAASQPGWSGVPIIGVDLSAAMLSEARHRGTLAVQADARRLPFTRGSFARVVCITGLVAREDVEAALRAVLRVLKPGGYAAFSLRPTDVPDALLEPRPGLAVERVHEGPAGIDRLVVWSSRH